MSANVGDGAKKFGEKLMAEVEVEDLSVIFKSLHELGLLNTTNENATCTYFGVPELDSLCANSTPPILELVSPPPTHHPSGAGKTSLLYLIIAYAILPTSFTSLPLPGQNAAIILFDPLHHFSVPRLARILFNIVSTLLDQARIDISSHAPNIQSLITTSLLHVHIFRPQSWPSTLATLAALPDHLFDPTRHKSIHRRIHSIILDDIDAFLSSIHASPSTHFHPTSPPTHPNPNPHPRPNPHPNTNLSAASTALTTSLLALHTSFSAALILATHSMFPTSFRPALPSSWPRDLPTTRVAVSRVPVVKFAPGLSVQEALVTRGQPWEVVRKARFEVRKVGVGGDGKGFVFRVEEEGVVVERGE